MVFINSHSVASEIKRQQNLAREITAIQSQVSSGRKFEKPSDAPQEWLLISNLGRQQALAESWQNNLDFATSRAEQAGSGLRDINNLMTRVTELLVASASTNEGSPGAEAVAQELTGIRETIHSILNQTDYQGTPNFDDTNSVSIPVGAGLIVEAVPTRQSIEEGVVTAAGTRTIYEILDDSIAAIRAADSTQRGVSLGEVRNALDHVIVAQSRQGVRSQRLEAEKDRITDRQLQLAESRSVLEDTDLTEAIANVQAKLTTLQAAQGAFARISQQTLFDLIR